MNKHPDLRIISLGAGVQSSVMSLMAAEGAFGDLPDAAIFADTQAEPQGVYDHLDWLEQQLPFPVHRVTAGNLTEDVKRGLNSSGHSFITIPTHLYRDGKWTTSRRQCTGEYKVRPIYRATRQMLGLKHRQRFPSGVWAEWWIGISTDEITRQRPPRENGICGRWPLIDAGMSRQDCKDWFAERYGDRRLPRSACTFCPYHSEAEWRNLRDNDPAGWEQACSVDDALRAPQIVDLVDGELYLRRRLESLRNAAFGKEDDMQLNLFDEECEGMCGV